MRFEQVEVDWHETGPKKLHEIIGSDNAKRALEVALVGDHEFVLLSSIRAPASDLLRAAAAIATERNYHLKGTVVPVCYCGAFGHPTVECRCTTENLQEYAKECRPVIKSAYMVIEVVEPRPNETLRGNEHEDKIVQRIMKARTVRPPEGGMDSDARELLAVAVKEFGVDVFKASQVAATIAQMDGADSIHINHVAEAVQYQSRKVWLDPFEKITV